MKIIFSYLIIFSLITQGTTPMMQVAMKIAGEQILLALVTAALNAVRNLHKTPILYRLNNRSSNPIYQQPQQSKMNW
jgi:hypothetical protein